MFSNSLQSLQTPQGKNTLKGTPKSAGKQTPKPGKGVTPKTTPGGVGKTQKEN